jgi:predicted DNA-binding antitoxin AbrB/MazE fold protein
MQTITATFEDRVLKPAQPLDLPAHAEVRVTIELLPVSPLTVGKLNAFLRSLPALGDDAEGFSQDVRAARHNDLTILTDNVDEFSRVPGLRVIPFVP